MRLHIKSLSRFDGFNIRHVGCYRSEMFALYFFLSVVGVAAVVIVVFFLYTLIAFSYLMKYETRLQTEPTN